MKLFLRNGVQDTEASHLVDNYVLPYLDPIGRPEMEALRFKINFQKVMRSKTRVNGYKTPGLRLLRGIGIHEMLRNRLLDKAARCVQRWFRRFQWKHPGIRAAILRR